MDSQKKSNEMVTVELDRHGRYELAKQIMKRYGDKKNFKPTKSLCEMGFDIDWPFEGEITLAQLVVMGHKLGCGIEINGVKLTTKDAKDTKEKKFLVSGV